ncbi:hypothetical protein [Mesorhizobium sp. B2-7-1]|uniref:DUF6894 family protein n=1 Tax=Mesorhizobium sp. B2-7-1 TaxID=2589909 RepID=UPI0011264710|nr:hypothetical protein [Mesorhizobium sp. B2-7-1]TPJ71848.1 hypothetical protein FJ471_08110 [Mesorhizobium sp. B2-7-1]
MPTFFFDIKGNDSSFVDTDGTQYAGPGEAQADAVRMLLALAQDEARETWQNKLSVVVSDENRQPLMEANIDCRVTVF